MTGETESQCAIPLKKNHSSRRQTLKISNDATLTLDQPLRINELLSLRIDELIRISDGTVADPGDGGNVFRRLGLAHEMRSGVNTCRGDGQGGAPCQHARFVHLLGDLLRDGGDLEAEIELVAEAGAQFFWIG